MAQGNLNYSETANSDLGAVRGSAYECVICNKEIIIYEVCEDCAKTNNCFDEDMDNHKYKSGTKDI